MRSDGSTPASTWPSVRTSPELVTHDYPDTLPWPGRLDEPCLCINARLVPFAGDDRAHQDVRGLTSGGLGFVRGGWLRRPNTTIEPTTFDSTALGDTDWDLFGAVHDLVRHHLAAFGARLREMVEQTDGPSLQTAFL